MKNPDKIVGFQLFVKVLYDRNLSNELYTDLTDFNIRNTLSKLKLIKLHFFTCASDKSQVLLNIFDNFYAMPFGHVESDVFSSISTLPYMQIDEKKTIITHLDALSHLQIEFVDYCLTVNSALDCLDEHNNKILSYSPFELVDLSHNWYSWIVMFETARQNNRYSEKIPVEIIKQEKKIFELA